MVTPKPRAGVALDLGQCVAAMRDAMPADTIICNGAGNFSSWWHRYWPYAAQPSSSPPPPARWDTACPPRSPASCFPDRAVVALAGDGDFMMNGQELATASSTMPTSSCW
jgi:acetolactate synthase-1/2/3 large subunit